MRCFFLVLLLVFPVSAIAANAESDQSASIASLAHEVQQLQTENQKLSARISVLEKRLPSPRQKISVSDRVSDLDGAAPTVPKQHEKP
jgi:cell division septum initiation protein DivIVA